MHYPDSRWMEEEHRLLADSTRRFFANELIPHRQRWREQGMVDKAFWVKAGQAGLGCSAH